MSSDHKRAEKPIEIIWLLQVTASGERFWVEQPEIMAMKASAVNEFKEMSHVFFITHLVLNPPSSSTFISSLHSCRVAGLICAT